MKKFIEQVVLCPVCWLPETYLQIYGKKIVGVCQACGKNEELKIVNEKFRRYILQHPPPQQKIISVSHNDIHDDGNTISKDVVWYSDTSKEGRSDGKKKSNDTRIVFDEPV